MSNCWFIDILPADLELERLRQLGMLTVDTTSWRHTGRNVPGLMNLLREAGVAKDGPQATDVVVLSIAEVRRSSGRSFSDVYEYFYELTRQSLDRLGVQSSLDIDMPDILAFNLMPFYPRAAIADRVMNGICHAVEAVPNLSDTCLAFFVRTHPPFSDNNELKRLIQSKAYPSRAIILDLDGFLINLERSNVKGRGKPRKTRSSVARSVFERVLRFKDKGSFRRALVYQTNMNIGHFDVGTCHVRTHYDLSDFVRRDNVFERLYSEFGRFTTGFDRIAIVTTGLERNALAVLSDRIQSASTNDSRIAFGGRLQSRQVKWMGHFFADVVNTTAEQVKEWARSYDCILVLTDIVNSGSTAHAVADAFRRISEDTETARKTQHGKPEVKILAVAKMKNSPPDIEASVVINRPYFPPDQASCLLCQLKQPIRKVEQDTWEEGFRYVDPAQLTPLDFWEMVRDCDALLMEKSYTGGKSLMHRVDTAKLVQRYRHWLRNVIAAKYRWRWGSNYPDMLLTVKEEAGLRFAALVGEAFWPHKCRIVGIPRAVLDHGDEPSIELTDELAGCKKVQVRVLLVDDGINFGGTARKLVQFATEHGVNTLGMIVLDSRLKRNRIERLEALAADPDFRIEALYVWPSHPVVTRKLVSD